MTLSTEIKAVFDSIDEPRMAVRPDYTVAYVNAAFQRRYGASGYEGRRCHDVLFHLPGHCSACGEECPMERALMSGHQEEVLRRVHGLHGTVYQELQAVPVRGADGSVLYVSEAVRDRNGSAAPLSATGVVANSESVRMLLGRISRVAATEQPVLFIGEAGCGKRAFARLIHENSRRAALPFIEMDCATLTPEGLGAELMRVARTGLSGGTLYLSDVSELSPVMQLEVHRLLETGRFVTDGSRRQERADIRLICATKKNPQTLLTQAVLRHDLYYRLMVCALRVPPLSERQEDLRELCEQILDGERSQGRHITLSDQAFDKLSAVRWSGNVHELQAVLSRAALFCNGPVIEAADIEVLDTVQAQADETSSAYAETEALRRRISSWEGSREALAAELGISVRTLYRLIKKYGIR